VKPISLQHLSFRYEHPAREEPSWKTVVERWYQLDAPAYGLAQAYVAWKPRLRQPPALVFLASPQASNTTDFEFARSGANSPAKFVHTLSNIRCSPVCQVMEWAGPVICVQRDPSTQLHALREAVAALESGSEGPIWVLSVFKPGSVPDASRIHGHEAHAFVLSRESGENGNALFQVSKSANSAHVLTDLALHQWLESPQETFSLPGGYDLSKQEIS